MPVQIFNGDCRNLLKTLDASSVHCCVTSPPYFGLRDYGNAAQIGLEQTPDLFVSELVSVFREVRRVLRDDGTLWLNLGDSYAGSGRGGNPTPEASTLQGSKTPNELSRDARRVGSLLHAGFHEKARQNGVIGRAWVPPPAGLKQKDLIGIPWMVAFALRQPWTDWQIKTETMRAWVAGIVDGEGCISILQTKSSHSDSLSFPPIIQVRMCDRDPLDRLVEVVGSKIGDPQMPPSHLEANQRPSWQWKVVSEQAAKVIAEIYPFLTCKRKQAIVAWNHQAFRTSRGNQQRQNGELEQEQFCKSLINDLNQRRPIDLPSWMIEPKVIQEPGWYLRQDCIWSKPNPMPESVRDRCTKSHEYLFLLSKSERYYFNQDAILEPIAHSSEERLSQDVDNQHGSDRVPGKTNGPMKAVSRAHLPGNSGKGNAKTFRGGGAYTQGRSFDNDVVIERESHGNAPNLTGLRNRRSVWTVATQPFREAHFATFPTGLIDPCIRAGCPKGGVVLDPFGGAGTTGLVADRLQRNAILFELNPDYVELAQRRLYDDAPLLTIQPAKTEGTG